MAKQLAVMARGGYVRSWQLAHTAAGARSLTKRLEGQGQAKRMTKHKLAREVAAKEVKVKAYYRTKPASKVMKALPPKTLRDSI